MASGIAFKAMESEEWETVKAILSRGELSNVLQKDVWLVNSSG